MSFASALPIEIFAFVGYYSARISSYVRTYRDNPYTPFSTAKRSWVVTAAVAWNRFDFPINNFNWFKFFYSEALPFILTEFDIFILFVLRHSRTDPDSTTSHFGDLPRRCRNVFNSYARTAVSIFKANALCHIRLLRASAHEAAIHKSQIGPTLT
jgi:hypothetical protein